MNFKINALFTLLLMPISLLGQQTALQDPPVVHLTAEQDHQRMMDLLGMKTIRRGVEGNASSPFAANYDESKANPYPQLPGLLLFPGGKKVDTASLWWNSRRPQIVELFDREIYGRAPAKTPKVHWVVTSTDRTKLGDTAVVTKSLTGHVDNSAYPLIDVDIQLELTAPAATTGPVPAIIEFGSISAAKPGVAPSQAATDASPGWQQQLLARGWGYGLPPACERPHAGAQLANLSNGNTIICSRGGHMQGPQLVKITPDKKVVWVLQDWQQLGPATAVQVLDEPGIPEHPGGFHALK